MSWVRPTAQLRYQIAMTPTTDIPDTDISDPSRTWRINDVTGSGLHQIRNVRTNKCLTIAGGVSTENNVTALQFNCDSDLSRSWVIRLKL